MFRSSVSTQHPAAVGYYYFLGCFRTCNPLSCSHYCLYSVNAGQGSLLPQQAGFRRRAAGSALSPGVPEPWEGLWVGKCPGCTAARSQAAGTEPTRERPGPCAPRRPALSAGTPCEGSAWWGLLCPLPLVSVKGQRWCLRSPFLRWRRLLFLASLRTQLRCGVQECLTLEPRKHVCLFWKLPPVTSERGRSQHVRLRRK